MAERDMNKWDAWKSELQRVNEATGYAGPVDAEAYRSYYDEGDTPAEAWIRDIRENA